MENNNGALRESEERFRQLFDSMSSGVAVYAAKNDGEDFIFTDINKSGERISQVKKEQVVGKSVLWLFPGVKKIGLFDVFKQVWKTGKPMRHPVSLYKDERIAQWVENYVYKLPSGEIAAMYDDVTEQKKMEEEARKRLKELEIIYKANIGREERMLELKKEVKRLRQELEARKGDR